MIWWHPFAEFLFWTCALLVVYSYAVYPLLVSLLAYCFGRTAQPQSPADADLPSLALLIAAHNEESEIAARIENALGMNYPREKLEILIASDGSTDATADIVRGYAAQGVRLLDYRVNRGKATTLNAAMEEVRSDVVILSDANTHMDPESARHLVRWFDDPAVGAVCGRLSLHERDGSRNADSLYWKYETFMKKCESRLGALLGANGANYAIRRELFVPIPPDTIIDDFVIPLQARLRTGCAILFDHQSVAREETPENLGAEFRRRARIGAGGYQSICLLWPLLHPRHGWISFTFLSHKILRWLCPFFLLGMLGSTLALADHPLYRWALLGQSLLYCAAALAHFVPGRWTLLKPLRLPSMFALMNLALLVGFSRWLRGSQKGTWQRTARVGELTGTVEQRCAGVTVPSR